MLVPPVVRNKALAAGAGPLARRTSRAYRGPRAGLWGITVGRPYPDATEAFVAEARPASVLKLMIPRDGDHARNEITVLRLTGGDGCVRLLRADQERGALLLERLGR
jgi:streptomycin 6-kinase